MTTEDQVTLQRQDLSEAQRARLQQRLLQARQSATRKSSTRPAIEPKPGRDRAPLSHAQERLWFLDQLVPDRAVYNLYEAIRMRGPVDPALWQRGLNALVDRHAVFRTNFAAGESGPVQIISESRPLSLKQLDLSAEPEATRETRLRQALREEARRPFDLQQDALLRALLVRVAPDHHVLLLVMHHIISDGWTLGVMFRELAALHNAFASDQPSPLPPLPIQFADFAAWERETLTPATIEKSLQYWQQQLAGAEPLEFPTDHPRRAGMRAAGASQTLQISPEMAQALRSLSQREGATLFMTLLAAFQALLHRYTGQDDLSVGSCVAGRPQVELEQLAGFFVNTIVLRTKSDSQASFSTLLNRTRETVLGAMAHQDVPFDRLVASLQPDRNNDRNPFFEIMFVLQSAAGAPPRANGLQFEPIELDNGTAKFDLTLSIAELSNGGLHASLEYSTELFEASTITRFLAHFQQLLGGVVADPSRPIAELPLLNDAERQQILVEWNGAHTEYPRDASIAALFAEQVARHPDQVAIRGNATLTYRQLDERANRLARHLQRLGTKPGSLIALCLDRSPELIVSLLAILKTGCAYVSLDPAYPAERLAFMLADTAAPVLITESRLASVVQAAGAATASGAQRPVVLTLDVVASALAFESSEDVAVSIPAESLAYVSYTSGSTGQPKGVCVTHRGVVRLVRDTDYLQFGPEQVFLQFAPVAFDASTLEIWGPLLNGGSIAVFPAGPASLSELGAFLLEHKVTTAWLTAGLFHQMVEENPSGLRGLKQLLSGGDVLSPTLVARAAEFLPETRLINGYGPTENTTFTTCHPIVGAPDLRRSIPIGRPIANTTVYILDSRMQPVAPGVPGDLYTGGDGLATGYLNRPELTAERFIRDPFSPDPSARLYRTGDRARWLPNGTIEFLGRADRQVKIRGFRIEPDEIEKALAQHPAVQNAVIDVQTSSTGERRLVGYVVCRAGDRPAIADLRQHLAQKLPDYMVPAAIVPLDALPLNANGKVDRKALPAPDGIAQAERASVPPRNPTETRIAAIWQKVLGVPTVGVHDNFFELGGHSLAGVKLVATIEREFGKRLPLATLFQAPTVAELALRLEPGKSVRDAGSSLIAMQPRGDRPPLFLVHGAGGGNLWIYTNLVPHLGSDQPVYALESRAVRGRQPEFERIEDMAAYYITQIRTVQPRGPYRLGGYCFGGNVAYEMARQLEAAGEKVALVALLDSSAANSSYQRIPWWSPAFQLRFAQNTAYWLSDFSDMTLREQWSFVRRKSRILMRKLTRPFVRAPRTGIDVEEVIDVSRFPEIELKLWAAHLRAITEYRPGPYGGRVTLFRTRGQPFFCSMDPHFGWGSLAAGVDTVPLPGAHEHIFLEPNVRELCRSLRARLDQVLPSPVSQPVS